jgi:hypothetical protein
MLKIDSISGELIQIKFEIKPIKQKKIKNKKDCTDLTMFVYENN